MSLLSSSLAIAKKDLTIELRTREITVSTGFFALLIAALTSLSFFVDDTLSRNVAPGVLYVTVAFSAVLAISRSWAREREQDAMRALLVAPIPRLAIYVGKAISTLAFLVFVELLLVPLVAILYHVDFADVLGRLVAILGLATLGIVLSGTLFGAMTVKTSARDLMLSVVLFPLITPVLLGAVVATRELLGHNDAEVIAWLKILLAYDVVVGLAAGVVFDALVSE
ncbi:MAG: heme exporter protein CcmB [Sandaracinaceae bacterium]|nr:heme exporter protein CcmB [Sandaracinaceae bacterium]